MVSSLSWALNSTQQFFYMQVLHVNSLSYIPRHIHTFTTLLNFSIPLPYPLISAVSLSHCTEKTESKKVCKEDVIFTSLSLLCLQTFIIPIPLLLLYFRTKVPLLFFKVNFNCMLDSICFNILKISYTIYISLFAVS